MYVEGSMIRWISVSNSRENAFLVQSGALKNLSSPLSLIPKLFSAIENSIKKTTILGQGTDRFRSQSTTSEPRNESRSNPPSASQTFNRLPRKPTPDLVRENMKIQGVVVIRPETCVAIIPESRVTIRLITRKKMCGNDCFKTNHSKIPRTLQKVIFAANHSKIRIFYAF